MKCAEQKTKRVRHCYPRQELYHRFIHNDTMMYYESTNRCSVSSIGNILCIGTRCRYSKLETLEDDTSYLLDGAVAVIDRKNKRILINGSFSYHSFPLRNSLPSDYEVFYTKDKIPSYNILSRVNRDKLLKIHAKYLIDKFCMSLILPYSIIQGHTKVSYCDIKKLYLSNNYNEIKKFVEKYKLQNRSWYKKSISDTFANHLYKSWSKSDKIEFEYPSLKTIIDNTIFTQEETIKLEQVKFYSEYCYGHGIPMSDVVKNWNRTDWDRKLISKYNRSNVEWNSEEHTTWNDFVKTTSIIINDFRNKQIDKWIEQSRANYEKAVRKLNELNNSAYTVNDWREKKGYYNGSFRVEYKAYKCPRNKHDMGCWVDSYVSNGGYIKFANTQLRLNNNTVIETSRGARVPLDKSILLFKVLNDYVQKNKDNENPEQLTFNKLNLGIYNVRYFRYTDKITDNNVPINKKEWVIVIGCHHLWFDDIINFIHYYKLEKEFGI